MLLYNVYIIIYYHMLYIFYICYCLFPTTVTCQRGSRALIRLQANAPLLFLERFFFVFFRDFGGRIAYLHLHSGSSYLVREQRKIDSADSTNFPLPPHSCRDHMLPSLMPGIQRTREKSQSVQCNLSSLSYCL